MFDKKIISALAIGILLSASSVFASEADSILGLWNTEGNKSKIEIYKCGDKYCGRIAELKNPNYMADDKDGPVGTPKLDKKNPNPSLRNHTLLGLELMHGFSYSGDNVWKGGEIYNPEDGKTYKCKMTLAAPNRLDVRGFIGFSLLGKTQTWNR